MHILLLHGHTGNGNSTFLPYTREKCIGLGHMVETPSLPHPVTPQQQEWVEEAQKHIPQTPTELSQTVIIGHSLGGIAALRLVEQLPSDVKIKALILIGAPWEPRHYPVKDFFKTPFDFEGIRAKCEKIYIIHSEDDPVVPIEDGKKYIETFHAIPVIEKNFGHFLVPQYDKLIEIIAAL